MSTATKEELENVTVFQAVTAWLCVAAFAVVSAAMTVCLHAI